MKRQIELIEDAVELPGNRFRFYVERQQVELGVAGQVDYYYMPLSPLRGDDPNRECSNFRSCIDHFQHVLELSGYGDDWDAQRDLLLARSYELVRASKAVQRIYRDAFLKRRSFRPGEIELLDDDRRRIHSVVESRDKKALQHEMEKALEAVQLTREEEVAASTAMDHWLNAGVERYREQGDDGVQAWLGDVQKWYKKFRKRSPPLVQTFLRVFAYGAKISFYHKYANFWISLVPWLEEHRGLDLMSKRFLGLWHNQNQRAEVRASSVSANAHSFPRRIEPQCGGRMMDGGVVEVVPDVFCGQTLSLHPLTWILFDRPELRQLVGSCIAAPRFESALASGKVDDFPEYWGMIEAILTAAYLYQVAHAEQESGRNLKALPGRSAPAEGVPSTSLAPRSGGSYLSDYVIEAKKLCTCGGRFEYANTDLPVAVEKSVTLSLKCSCGATSSLVVMQHDIEKFLELRPKRSRERRPPK